MELQGDLDTFAFVYYVLTDISELVVPGEDIRNEKLTNIIVIAFLEGENDYVLYEPLQHNG